MFVYFSLLLCHSFACSSFLIFFFLLYHQISLSQFRFVVSVSAAAPFVFVIRFGPIHDDH